MLRRYCRSFFFFLEVIIDDLIPFLNSECASLNIILHNSFLNLTLCRIEEATVSVPTSSMKSTRLSSNSLGDFHSLNFVNSTLKSEELPLDGYVLRNLGNDEQELADS